MKLFIILTSYKEEETIGKAVEQVICPNRDLWPQIELLIVSADEPTLKKAEEVCQKEKFENYKLVRDKGEGKAQAINVAVETITNEEIINPNKDLLIFTDGDMYVGDAAIKNLLNAITEKGDKIAGVSGHPFSLDSRKTLFGYYSHLFCEAAHQKRLKDNKTPMSGYLYAIRPLAGIFPISAEVRAEDAYISSKVLDLGREIAYEPKALAYVKFPKNISDWYKQKTRSLGGNVQISQRSIVQDLKMFLFPVFFARSPKEILWSLLLYPLRLFLWIRIYFNHKFNGYDTGRWERIESTK